jgi:hypothetical protein
VKVVQLGFGAVGRENVRQLLSRGHQVVGIVDKYTTPDSQALSQAGLDAAARPVIARELQECLEAARAEVVLEATSFSPQEFLSVVRTVAAHPCDLISANGIVNISRMYPEVHAEANALATAAGIRVVGAGVVPGFLSDVVPLLMTGACARVDAIQVRRCSDFSKWGKDVMTRYGFGLTAEEFERRASQGRVVLFKNLWQSVYMLADELGWRVTGTDELKIPHVSARARAGDHISIAKGTVGGFVHRVAATCDKDRRIEIEVQGYVDPQGDGERPALNIDLSGTPQISMTISGDLLHGAGVMASTSATMVNSIAALHRATPGLKSVADLSPVVCRD